MIMPCDSAIHFFCNEIVSKITNFLQLYINLNWGSSPGNYQATDVKQMPIRPIIILL